MLKMLKLEPDERLLAVSPVNRYKVLGPGRVWLTLRQRQIIRFSVGFRAEMIYFDSVRSADNIPLNVTAQLLYRVNPELFRPDMLHRLPGLDGGGWKSIAQWHTEYVLRLLVGQLPWQSLAAEGAQARLERQLAQTVRERVKMVALEVVSAALVKVALPEGLQQKFVEAQQTQLDAAARAAVLQQYAEIFGPNLAQAMPLILQWELMNSIHKNNPQFLLTSGGLNLGAKVPEPAAANGQPHFPSMYQIQLPLQ